MTFKNFIITCAVILFILDGLLFLRVKSSKTSKSVNSFDTSLIQVLNNGSQRSWFISPTSIKSILEILYTGSAGKTQSELSQIINISNKKDILAEQTSLKEKPKDGVIWKMSNRILVKNSFKLSDSFKSDVKSIFDSQVDNVDFKDPRKIVDDVNSWISKATNKLIDHLLDANDLDSSSVMVLLNAVYFQGTWKYSFKQESTVKDCFFSKPNKCDQSDMMKQTNDELKYGEHQELSAKILQLPYNDERYSMVILLPDEHDGVNKIINKLSEKKNLLTDFIKQMQTENVKLTMPKFKSKFKMNINEPLQKMGLKSIFDVNVDFSAMSNNKGMIVSDIIHEAHISVDEKGTVAAASTGVIMSRSLIPDEPAYKEFLVNRPFLYLILYNDNILFSGYYKGQ